MSSSSTGLVDWERLPKARTEWLEKMKQADMIGSTSLWSEARELMSLYLAQHG